MIFNQFMNEDESEMLAKQLAGQGNPAGGNSFNPASDLNVRKADSE